jgi:hypothetical protein
MRIGGREAVSLCRGAGTGTLSADMEGRTVHLLGFAARIEREATDGVAYLRIDDTTAPGQVRRAHAALEERLATQEPFEADLLPDGRLRVTAMMHETDAQVLRVKVEVA